MSYPARAEVLVNSTLFLSRSPGLPNRSLGIQPLWVLVFPTASYLQLIWSPNWLIGGLRAPSAGCWLSLPHLVTNGSGLQTDWISCALLYNSSTPTFFLWASQIALIQPIHGHTLLFLDRMHLLFIQVHFLFWQPGRVVGQYTTKVEEPSHECPVYDTKQSDGEAPVMLELWGMRTTPSLPSLPGPLWPGVVVSMGQKELNFYLR